MNSERNRAMHQALEDVLVEIDRIEVRQRSSVSAVTLREIKDRDKGPTILATASLKVHVSASRIVFPSELDPA